MIPRAFAALLACLASAGCTTRLGDLTIVTPKNLPQEFQIVQENVEGKECLAQILIIPLGTTNPTIDGAIDAALEKAPGADALVNASIYTDLIFTFFFNQSCVRINGDAIRTRPSAP
jgi:hypothetical protein